MATSTTIDLRDLAGNRMAPITEWLKVTSLHDPDPGKPVLVSTDAAVVDGDTLTLTYDKALHGGAVPPPTAFTVEGTDATTTVDPAAISGTTLLLTLNPAVAQGDTEITVSYDKTNPPLTQNPWGTQADAFSNQAVINNTSASTVPAVAAEAASFEIAGDHADAASVGTAAAVRWSRASRSACATTAGTPRPVTGWTSAAAWRGPTVRWGSRPSCRRADC